jgi:hypothetical protein
MHVKLKPNGLGKEKIMVQTTTSVEVFIQGKTESCWSIKVNGGSRSKVNKRA